MINIGIIGCGKIAQIRHIPEYVENKNCRLVGFYDVNQERVKEIASKYNGIAYNSVEELLANKEVDAVSVCTANASHAEITIKALKMGKHVLCEKPMATTIEDCEEMVKTAKEVNKFLMIGQNQRLAKAHVVAKELIEKGIIGKLITFRTTFGHSGPETWSIDPGKNTWFFDKKKAAMGVMADLGIHKTDVLCYMTGAKVISTSATLVTLDKRDENNNPISVDDNAICVYTLSNNVTGTMCASWSYYGQEDNSTVFYGTNGILKVYDDPKHPVTFIKKDGTIEYYEADQIQTNDNQTKSGIIDEWIDCLENNHTPSISGESVLPSMRAIFASIKSSETKQTVEIPENKE